MGIAAREESRVLGGLARGDAGVLLNAGVWSHGTPGQMMPDECWRYSKMTTSTTMRAYFLRSRFL